MRIIVGMVAMLLILTSHTTSAGGQPAATTRVDSVHLQLRVNKATYAPGETVEISLVLINQGQSSATFEFPTGQMVDFAVFRDGQLIWQWSSGKAFTQAFTQLRLEAGQTRTFRATWDQRNNHQRPVPPGSYELTALLPISGGRIDGPRLPFSIGEFATAPPGSLRDAPVSARGAAIGQSAVGEVLVKGRTVLRIRTAAGGLSPAQRADIIAARLRRYLVAGLRPEELVVVRAGRDAAILWRNQLVVTADARHARLNMTTPAGLAASWRRLLVAAFSE